VRRLFASGSIETIGPPPPDELMVTEFPTRLTVTFVHATIDSTGLEVI